MGTICPILRGRQDRGQYCTVPRRLLWPPVITYWQNCENIKTHKSDWEHNCRVTEVDPSLQPCSAHRLLGCKARVQLIEECQGVVDVVHDLKSCQSTNQSINKTYEVHHGQIDQASEFDSSSTLKVGNRRQIVVQRCQENGHHGEVDDWSEHFQLTNNYSIDWRLIYTSTFLEIWRLTFVSQCKMKTCLMQIYDERDCVNTVLRLTELQLKQLWENSWESAKNWNATWAFVGQLKL